MNRIAKILFLLIISVVRLSAQLSYFQQQVNYKIEVALDDNKHFLQGKVEMEYFNNSPDSIDKIYIHLWGNAYKNIETAFAKQKINSASRTFYFSTQEEKGYISNIDFKIDGQKVKWSLDPINQDIAIIFLEQTLYPGNKITISTPFLLKIPKVFSRLGHDKQDYYITQWYPKPAVYDKFGWHPLAYLDQGEFYSEFGNYDVSITLPANYIVGATGELQSEDEKLFLKTRINQTVQLQQGNIKAEKFLGKASADKNKTINYVAKRVHDFAWFASKDFLVVQDTAIFSNGIKVPTFGFFTKGTIASWSRSAFFVKRSLEYLSERVGQYPWPVASAVFGDLKAGGGMEYPMITIINVKGSERTVDEVITHEVGHNWFYGILASNEREHPWMDEGINTYYENSYMEHFYPSYKSEERFKVFNMDFNEASLSKFFHLRKLDQALSLSSADFAYVNYGLDVYTKTARYFKILDNFLGREEFDKAMKAYYTNWSFRHPYPYDLKRSLENETAKDLSWLFENLINKNQMVDYKILKVKGDSITLKNITNNPVPISLTQFKANQKPETKWVEGFNGKETLKLDFLNPDKVILDDNDLIFDIHKNNNYYKKNALFNYSRPLKIRFYGLNEDNEHQHINLSPIIGWNNGDKTMIGLGIHSDPMPGHAFRYYLLPMYSLVNADLVGQARLELNSYSYKAVERFTLGLFAKSYTYDFNTVLDYKTRYIKIAPFVSVEMGRWKKWTHKITYTPNLIYKDVATFDKEGNFSGKESRKTFIHTLDYDLSNKNAVNQNNTKIRVEQQNYAQKEHYLKLSIDWHEKFYYSPKRSIDLRVFMGGFIENTKKHSASVNSDDFARASFSLASTGADDYLFEGPYLGRTATTGLFGRQIDISDGGMKFPAAYTFGQFGYTNSFLTAINLKSSIPTEFPLKLPIKPYFDIAYFDDLRPINMDKKWSENIVWSGGLMLDFGNFIAFYFPIINSQNLREQYNQSVGNDYFKRITFSIQLPVMRVSEIIKRFSFD